MTPHLRGYVRAYVDRALPPAMLHLYDRHLVCCLSCRDEVERERRIVASLRSETGVPTSLRSSLLGLAAASAAAAATAEAADVERSLGPRVPTPPAGLRGALPVYDPVPTVHPGAPALHRSPMRAAVVASIAAGASVAAAWGLAVAPVPAGTRVSTARVPVASFGASTLVPGTTVLPVSRSGSSSSRSSFATSSSGGAMSSTLGAVTVPYWVMSHRVVNRAPQVGQARFSGSGSAESTP